MRGYGGITKFIMAPKSRKDKWRKADVADVIDAHLESVATSRVAEKVSASPAPLFRVDTEGALNRKQSKRLENRLDKKRPHELAAEAHWAKERVKALKAQKLDLKKKRKTIGDLWGDDAVAPAAKKFARTTKLFAAVPAVLVAEEGQSVNPSQEMWKTSLLRAAAQCSVERERHEIVEENVRPVLAILKQMFTAEIVETLTTNQQIKLLNLARLSKELLEEPEDFLARTLPTILSVKEGEEAEGDVKDEERKVKVELEQSSEVVTIADDAAKEKGVLGKTTKERNRLARRAVHELEVEKHKSRKAFNSSFDRLGEILQSLETEAERTNARIAYRQALGEYVREAQKKGEVVPFRFGKSKYAEPVDDVVAAEDLEKQEGSLRKLATMTHNSALKERFASIKRRGMVELGLTMSAENFRLHKSRLNLVKNRKIKGFNKVNVQVNKQINKRKMDDDADSNDEDDE